MEEKEEEEETVAKLGEVLLRNRFLDGEGERKTKT